MPNLTTTTHDNFIPEIWSKEIIKAVEENLVLANLVWRFDSDVKGMGDVVHIPSITNLVANDKVINVPTSPQAPTETNTDITINQHKETTFVIEDITEVQSSHNLMSQYTQKAGYAIAEEIDGDIAALAATFANVFGTFNTAITTDVVLDSVEQLDIGNVPDDGKRSFVFHPNVKRDLLDLAAYSSSDFVDGRPIHTGSIGMLYGVNTFMTTNVLVAGNNTSNMMFHSDAIGLAMQTTPRTQSQYVLADMGWRVTVDAIYGVAETRDAFGILVRT